MVGRWRRRPACALAGSFAKASAQQATVPLCDALLISFGKTRGAADRCHRQTLKDNLSPIWGLRYSARAPLRRRNRGSEHGVRATITRYAVGGTKIERATTVFTVNWGATCATRQHRL